MKYIFVQTYQAKYSSFHQYHPITDELYFVQLKRNTTFNLGNQSCDNNILLIKILKSSSVKIKFNNIINTYFLKFWILV